MICDPLRGGDGVLDGRGKLVFGRQPIVDGDYDQFAVNSQSTAHHVVGVQIADHPAAAVEEDEARRKAVRVPELLRAIDARRNRAVQGRDTDVAYILKLGWLGVGDGAAGQIGGAGFRRRQRLVRRTRRVLEGFEDGGGVGIKNNGHRETF